MDKLDLGQIISVLGGIIASVAAYLGIVSNNKKDVTTTLIENYQELNDELKSDKKVLDDKITQRDLEIKELEKQIGELKLEIVELKNKLSQQ
mgnify:FL=1